MKLIPLKAIGKRKEKTRERKEHRGKIRYLGSEPTKRGK